MWLSSDPSVTEALTIYKAGSEEGDNQMLLNPCSAVLGAKPLDQNLSGVFIKWLLDAEGGQKVVSEFKKNGEVLYTPARAPQ